MPKVYNKYHKNAPIDAVYVGRPTAFGNPFTHLKGKTAAEFMVETREQAISAYKEWIFKQPEVLKKIKAELAGKDLVCWCAPRSCHADVLIEIANS